MNPTLPRLVSVVFVAGLSGLSGCSGSRASECALAGCDAPFVQSCEAAVDVCEHGAGAAVQTCVDGVLMANEAACGVSTTDDATVSHDDGGTDAPGDTDDGGSGDTDATDTAPADDGTVRWDEGAWANDWTDFIDCSRAGEVTLHATTRHWGGRAALYMSQTKDYGDYIAWEESHTLEETAASAQDGVQGYSEFSRTLATGARLDSQASDVSTLWHCNATLPTIKPTLASFDVSFALAVWGPANHTATPDDCIYFGQDPDELITDGYTGGTGVNGSGRSLPPWLAAPRCRKLLP